jgi:hypothetical protein
LGRAVDTDSPSRFAPPALAQSRSGSQLSSLWWSKSLRYGYRDRRGVGRKCRKLFHDLRRRPLFRGINDRKLRASSQKRSECDDLVLPFIHRADLLIRHHISQVSLCSVEFPHSPNRFAAGVFCTALMNVNMLPRPFRPMASLIGTYADLPPSHKRSVRSERRSLAPNPRQRYWPDYMPRRLK